ncbi:MAG: PKD domain-containing protein [Saprospiraceae bacterium]
MWSITPSGSSNWEYTDTLMTNKSDTIEVHFKKTGTFTIKLSTTTPCGTDEWEKEIEVLEGPTASLQPGPTFCASGTYTPDISYSGTINSYEWTFDGGTPSSSTDMNPSGILYNSPGTYTVTLVVDGACGELTKTTIVTVDVDVSVAISPAGQYCQGSSIDTLMANVTGGIWSGNGIVDTGLGVFDPLVAGVGNHSITYTYGSGACQDDATITIIVVASESVTVNDVSVCANEAMIILTASPSGGNWTGTNVTSTGVFDIQASGEGDFIAMYNFTDANNCEVSASTNITVEMTPNVSIQDTTFLCVDGGTVDLTLSTLANSNVSGGIYTFIIDGTPVSNNYTLGNSVNSVPIEVIYTVGACTVMDTALLSLILPPTLTVGPAESTVCISDGNIIFESNPSGGQWYGTGINSNTGEVDLVSAGGGMHQYTYKLLENTTCEVVGMTSIEIIDLSAGLSAGNDISICEGDHTSYTLDGAAPTGGYWTGLGISDSLIGEIDINQLAVDSIYYYNYCLENTNFDDCEACDTRTFIIHSTPKISYILVGGACIGESFTISDSTLFGDVYHWNFGDGTISNLKEPTHSYSTSGNYDIVLTVTSTFGCKMMNTRSVYVSRPPIVLFDLAIDEGCAPFEVELTNNSYGDSISYEWIIANDTFFIENPENIILDPIFKDSIFILTLNVTNSCGTVTHTEEVLVHPYPLVDIGLSVDEGCSPVVIEFGNNTLGNPDSYIWNLDNGNTSMDSIPPAQTYTTSDTLVSIYDIILISSNECGIDTGYEQITVYPPDVRAFLSIDTTFVCQYDSFHVASFSTPGSIITWSIFDENGQQVEGYDGEDVTISISDPGKFTIVLFASRCGTDSDTTTISVLPAPEIAFELPPFICQGDTLHITNDSPSLSETLWTFGDGDLSNEYSPFHVFDTAGVYSVTLEGFSTINNCPRKISKEIEVIGRPTAGFNPSVINGCRPLTIDFTNTSYGGISYNWYWGDGTSSSFEDNPQHTFTSAGVYTVHLITFDEYGCFGDTAVSNITVYELPESIFTTDKDTYCQFIDSIYVTNKSIDDITYQWTINGVENHLESPVLFSQNAGYHEIELLVENSFGCIDISTQAIEILPSPISDLSPSDTVGCQPFSILFGNNSQQSDEYIWQINNIESSSDTDLNYLFIDDGVFEIKLIAINNNNCPNDTTGIEVLIKEKPEAKFNFDKDADCGVPTSVSFTDNSINDIIDRGWDFGNGTTDQVISPTVIYNNDQDFITTLIVENSSNCLDTITESIPVWHQPIADISIDKYLFCEGEIIKVENNSQHVNEYQWVIGGLDTITSFTPEFLVDEAGQFTIELVVSYNDYCKDSTRIDEPITVFVTPDADFEYKIDRDENIIGDVEFENTSVDYTRLEWKLGDGNYSNEESFIHEYDINRGIEVTLFSINDNQGLHTCIDSITKLIEPEWLTKYFVPNAFSPDYGSDEVRLFTPKGIGIKEYEISVYSPWGKRVWQSTKLKEGHPLESWNGRINNLDKEAPQGSYSWLAKVVFVDGNVAVYKGNVVLLR